MRDRFVNVLVAGITRARHVSKTTGIRASRYTSTERLPKKFFFSSSRITALIWRSQSDHEDVLSSELITLVSMQTFDVCLEAGLVPPARTSPRAKPTVNQSNIRKPRSDRHPLGRSIRH